MCRPAWYSRFTMVTLYGPFGCNNQNPFHFTSWFHCHGCIVMVALAWLHCQGVHLSWLHLSWLHCHGCIVMVALAWLHLSWLHCHGCIIMFAFVMVALSWLHCQAWIVMVAFLMVALSWLHWHDCMMTLHTLEDQACTCVMIVHELQVPNSKPSSSETNTYRVWV